MGHDKQGGAEVLAAPHTARVMVFAGRGGDAAAARKLTGLAATNGRDATTRGGANEPIASDAIVA